MTYCFRSKKHETDFRHSREISSHTAWKMFPAASKQLSARLALFLLSSASQTLARGQFPHLCSMASGFCLYRKGMGFDRGTPLPSVSKTLTCPASCGGTIALTTPGRITFATTCHQEQ